MKIFKVYTDERSNRSFTEHLLISVIVVAENEKEALRKTVNRYGGNFVCDASELLVKEVKGDFICVEYNH